MNNIIIYYWGYDSMPEIVETMKLHIHASEEQDTAFALLAKTYADACNYVSNYVFNHGFILNSFALQNCLYHTVRQDFGMKSQMTISVFKTVVARYKSLQEQLLQNPFKYKTVSEGKESWICITRTLEWLQKPILFSRPQADLVREKDYSFVDSMKKLSLNTLKERECVQFDMPDYFKNKFMDGSWRFGGGKLIKMNGEWYFHVSMTKEISEEAKISPSSPVIGIDRGIRFLATVYDDNRDTTFFSGKEVSRKRQSYADTRAELQAKGTKSAKRVLKRISGRENRWMSDVNHQISKTLVDAYGKDALFVLENLTGVSFDENNLKRSPSDKRELRSWSFYQLEQFLKYKAEASCASVINVPANYTSQRCPACGRIRKENRNHKTHEYVCDECGYRSNDDRLGAINVYTLGVMFVSGEKDPKFHK